MTVQIKFLWLDSYTIEDAFYGYLSVLQYVKNCNDYELYGLDI